MTDVVECEIPVIIIVSHKIHICLTEEGFIYVKQCTISNIVITEDEFLKPSNTIIKQDYLYNFVSERYFQNTNC